MLTKGNKRMIGPQNPHCDAVGAEKYRGRNEDHREASNRVAAFLQDHHEHYMAFREITMDQRFLPPGRVQAGAGSLKNVTLYNCFVMPEIHDSFVDGPTEQEREACNVLGLFPPESIMEVGKLSAKTMRQGGGVGYDISTLRPCGDAIRGVGGITDGPIAFAHIYDKIGSATASAGNRRGAQMLVMRVDHPDIEAFIRAKHVANDSIPWEYRPLRGFNMSIAITDEFMECVSTGRPFPLKFRGQVYREVDPIALWDMIMRSTYDWAEPGVLFIDTINRMNNLHYCETIAATNPCGEQPLPPYGACLLGSFNSVKYLKKDADGNYYIDYDLLGQDIPHVVRSMDNVIDRSRYPLYEQMLEAKRKRRMGLGITGLANALEAMGHPYGTKSFLDEENRLMKFLANKLYQASALLAKEKGSFPMYDEENYMRSVYIKSLEEETQSLIRQYGIRNSHLTSVAPTGTISLYADNVSSGIEPVVDYEMDRTIIMKEGPIKVKIPDYGVDRLGVRGRTVFGGKISAKEHIDVLCVAQRNVDSAVSKTCNVPFDFDYNEFKNLYAMAWENGAKGCTTYRPNEKYDEPIQSSSKVEIAVGGACSLDEFGRKTGSCAD